LLWVKLLDLPIPLVVTDLREAVVELHYQMKTLSRLGWMLYGEDKTE
jgi:hypothetical protein